MSLLSAVTQKEVLDSIKVDIVKGQTITLSGKVDLQYLPATVYVILDFKQQFSINPVPA